MKLVKKCCVTASTIVTRHKRENKSVTPLCVYVVLVANLPQMSNCPTKVLNFDRSLLVHAALVPAAKILCGAKLEIWWRRPDFCAFGPFLPGQHKRKMVAGS